MISALTRWMNIFEENGAVAFHVRDHAVSFREYVRDRSYKVTLVHDAEDGLWIVMLDEEEE